MNFDIMEKDFKPCAYPCQTCRQRFQRWVPWRKKCLACLNKEGKP